jgi:putative transposase
LSIVFALERTNQLNLLPDKDSVDLCPHIEPYQVPKSPFRYVMQRHPFTIDAIVILPDHLHCIWTLPEGDANFSTRWRLIKSYFSRNCDSQYHGKMNTSRENKKEQTIWQRRFWEHLIKNEQDFICHVDYIHYNPVKHRLVNAPSAWEYSSFHRYVQQEIYQIDWGANEEIIFPTQVGYE